MHKIRDFAVVALLAAVVVAAAPGLAPAAPSEKEAPLIAVLNSDAKPADKAITCKRLAIWGSEKAVPALAKLLPDKELTSWARIALEAIPGPAADKALRDAMDKVKGRILIGVINSIAVRRDTAAINALTVKLQDGDPEVGAAAAEALGRIGGDKAVAALLRALADAPMRVRSAAAYGCVLCAERQAAGGTSAAATALYDKVRTANVPEQRIREGIRGAILARGADGVGLLIEQLESRDKERFGLGLRVARELPGGDVTEALVAALGGLAPDRRSLLLLALADRADPKALPALLAAAKSGPKEVRLMAMGALDKVGDASCVPVLLAAAVDADPAIAGKANTALARLPAGEADAAIAKHLGESTGKQRQILLGLVAVRRIESAIPAVVQCAQDDDPACRTAAVAAIGAIGGPKQVGDLVALLGKIKDADGRTGIDKALRTVCSRGGSSCSGAVLPLAKNSDAGLRMIALHALVCAGGGDALAAVQAALSDKDATVQDEAVRTLANWPSNWPEDAAVKAPLLALAKSGKKDLHRILALRGYLEHLRGTKKLGPAAKLAALKDIAPLIKRPEEKRLAISVLAVTPAAGAMEMLIAHASERGVSEEACAAIVELARTGDRSGIPEAERKAALQTVMAKARNGRTKRTAQGLLKAIK